LERLIVPLGIVTVLLLTATAITGALVRKRIRLYGWHKALAAITLLAAMSHGLLVLLANR